MNVQYDKKLDVLVVEISEELSVMVYERAIQEVLNSPSFHADINVIYDLRNAGAVSISTDQIRAVATRARSLSPKRGTSWKAAIVVSWVLQYGLGRMFEFLNDGAPYQVRVFRSMEEAQVWVADATLPT